MVARLESGKTGVSFDTIEKLSDALNVDPAELFTPQLANGTFYGAPLGRLVTRLAALKPEEIAWIERIVEASLTPKK